MSPEDNHKKSVSRYFSEDKDYWKTVYNDTLGKWTGFIDFEMRKRKELLYYKVKNTSLKKDDKILDIGCGTGGMLEEMVKDDYNLVAADISFDMIRETQKMSCKHRAEDILCVQSDIEHIPFVNNSFSCIICAGVLQYLQKDDAAIRELARIVTHDGRIMVTVPNLLRINNLLDPVYYLRIFQLIIHKLKTKKRNSRQVSDERDLEKNSDFSNRRYLYWQIRNIFRKIIPARIESIPISYGPLTLFRKEFLPLTLSIKLSNIVQRLSCKRGFGFLKIFANRWIFCLKKTN